MKAPIGGTMDTAIPISLTEGIRWPALPSRHAMNLLAIAQQMDDSQWWPPEMLRRHQFDQLAEMLAFAAHTVPFYGSRLTAAGFRPDKRFTDDIWRQVPVLTFDDIRGAGPAMASPELPPQHGAVSNLTVAAADGAPVTVLVTALSTLISDATVLREAQWDARILEGKLAVIAASGSDSDDWDMPFREVFFTGPSVFCDIGTAPADQAAWLERVRPDLLATTPENLAALAAYCQNNNVRLPSIRHVRSIGRPAPQALHERCRSLWDVRLFDGYVDGLAGAIAYPCPDAPHHHVNAERAVVEILDDAGQPCGRGQPGRVVVTPLHGLAMPLVRLDIGDIAAFGPPCPCGRGLPVLLPDSGRG